MILLCGIPTETSLGMVADALTRRDAEVIMVNQRDVRDLSLRLRVEDTGLHGTLSGPAGTIDLAAVTAVYLRFMDDRLLPELHGEPDGGPVRAAARAFHDLFGQWADLTGARVVNRYAAMGSNFSKPYQLQLIRDHGFAVPETLVTNDPDRVLEFHDTNGPLIYKSISSERSIVARLDPADRERLDRIRWCPVQFQGYVPGPNLRVHTIGDRAIGSIVHTDAVDYRYATRQTGHPATFAPYPLPDDLTDRCVRLAGALGLDVAGLDLKLHPDGTVYCLEVNPSPVFSYYEHHTGQPLADTIANHLDHTLDPAGNTSRPAANRVAVTT